MNYLKYIDLCKYTVNKFRKLSHFGRKLMRLHKDMSIKRKLPLMLGVQIIIPLLLIGLMSYMISKEILKNNSIDYSRDILSAMKFRVEDYTNNLSLISQNLLYEKEIYNVLNKNSINNDALNNYQNASDINNIFKRVILSRNEIQAIYLISNNKDYYYAEISGVKSAIPYDGILQKARQKLGKVIWYIESKDNKVNNVYLARTVYNQDNFKEIGLLVILVKKDFLETLCQGLVNKDIQNISIISPSNEQIVSKFPEADYGIDDKLLKVITGKKGSVFDNKKGVLITFVSMDEPDWMIVSYISLNTLFAGIEILRRWIILLSLISVFILTILSVFVAFDYINPINKLVKAMQSMKNNGELVGVKIDRNDEFGFLGENFNNMVDEINHLVKWIYREQITRKEAELKALQAQINPHFLFNTLESINWMAQVNGVHEISDMVSSLASLMDAVIGRDNKLITIGEECKYINNYISILKNRFGDRINIINKISEEVIDVEIPKLLIQPLIENAVYHGIEKKKKKEKGIIVLKVYKKGDKAIIEVVDNGKGVEQEELEMLNERLSMDNATYFKSLDSCGKRNIGIENVNRRIKLFFGEEYGLQIISKAGYYTRIIVSIPLEHKSRIKDISSVSEGRA